LLLLGDIRLEPKEGVGELGFPVAELFKPRGLKAQRSEHGSRSPECSQERRSPSPAIMRRNRILII